MVGYPCAPMRGDGKCAALMMRVCCVAVVHGVVPVHGSRRSSIEETALLFSAFFLLSGGRLGRGENERRAAGGKKDDVVVLLHQSPTAVA